MSAALLRDAMGATAKTAQLSPQSMGEINEMLSRIRPTTSGSDASYGSAASFGETGSGPPQPTAGKISDTIDNALSGKTGNLQFSPFSPGQADFEKTIDNIWPGSNKDEVPEAAQSSARQEIPSAGGSFAWAYKVIAFD
ncbi:MAG: hypothetical protein Q8L53_16300 [Aestuariivirga sp.]|nr:hypothetical protein [Aestuariivirga sp.]